MRKELGKIGDESRHTFTAEFSRFGIKNGWKGDIPTVLFKNVKLGDKVVSDHLWFDCGKQFDALDLQCGDIVEFSARVASYVKGYFGHRIDACWENPPREDWKLERPTKVRKIGHNENPETPRKPRNHDGEECSSLEEHASRIELARESLRMAPPQFHAVFVDGKGKEIATTTTEKEIWEQIGITEDQWKTFFRGLVGTLGKGDEISLKFKRRRNGQGVPPYYQNGVRVEKKKRYGDWKFAGYGFVMASYVLGWKEHVPLEIAANPVRFNGMETDKGRVFFVPLGALQEWEMSVEGTEYWKTTFAERMEKIAREKEQEKKEQQEKEQK